MTLNTVYVEQKNPPNGVPCPEKEYRYEQDAFGTVQIPRDRYWGAQTQRAITVFRVGRERFLPALIHALALQKMAAARANERLGCLDSSRAKAIVDAAREIQQGHFDDHFPLPVWQTGSGTQMNMNGNEVIANRANEMLSSGGKKPLGSKDLVHPNDHVNCSQSSNDSFPTMMHIATLARLQNGLIPSLEFLRQVLESKAHEFRFLIKIGRTHLMDAVPMTLGQTFDAFAHQISHQIARVHGTSERLRELPQGGTAVGSGLNTPPGFDRVFCEELNILVHETSDEFPKSSLDIKFIPADSKFESMGSHDALVAVSGVLNGIATTLLKISTDFRFLSSGPRCGLGELLLPHDGLTSSIMPGKQNPTLAEMMSQIAFQVMGSHTTVSMAGAAGGHFELNVAKPVIIYNILQSIDLLSDGIPDFARNLVAGLEANEKTLNKNVENSLLQVTALNPHIGYERVSKIVKKATAEDLKPRQAALALGLVSGEEYDCWTDPLKMVPSLHPEA